VGVRVVCVCVSISHTHILYIFIIYIININLMIRTNSIGLSCLPFFHLLTYALFKALLFMCAGGVIILSLYIIYSIV